MKTTTSGSGSIPTGLLWRTEVQAMKSHGRCCCGAKCSASKQVVIYASLQSPLANYVRLRSQVTQLERREGNTPTTITKKKAQGKNQTDASNEPSSILPQLNKFGRVRLTESSRLQQLHLSQRKKRKIDPSTVIYKTLDVAVIFNFPPLLQLRLSVAIERFGEI